MLHKIIGRVTALLLFGLSGVFGHLFWADHVLRRGCFNELGRCLDAQTGIIYTQQAGIVWALLCVAAFAAGVLVVFGLRRA